MVAEVERDVARVGPPAGLLTRDGLLRRRAAEEPYLERGAVQPRLADGRDGAVVAVEPSGAPMRPHEVLGQDAIEADLLCHEFPLECRERPSLPPPFMVRAFQPRHTQNADVCR